MVDASESLSETEAGILGGGLDDVCVYSHSLSANPLPAFMPIYHEYIIPHDHINYKYNVAQAKQAHICSKAVNSSRTPYTSSSSAPVRDTLHRCQAKPVNIIATWVDKHGTHLLRRLTRRCRCAPLPAVSLHLPIRGKLSGTVSSPLSTDITVRADENTASGDMQLLAHKTGLCPQRGGLAHRC